MENGQSTAAKLGLPPLTPEQQEALQKVSKTDGNLLFGGGMVLFGFLMSLCLWWGQRELTTGSLGSQPCWRVPQAHLGPGITCFGLEFMDTFGSMMGNCCWGG